ncbi:MAG: ACP S-malonyltransferase [Isosphaeraceae bacterium]|nr:ACP S-malonyltransferase [Isosphaeraceae bacterium]
MAKTAFLFPGQGAQAVGMGRTLEHELPAVRALFDRANEILGIDLRMLCFEGPAEALEATDMSQPAIFVASLAALEDLKTKQPEVVEACAGAAGLSLGEYTALVFAGALDFESGLRIVRRRGEAMQAAALATPSGMTSVLGLDEAAVDELCRRLAPHGRAWKANLLGPGNIVVSGEKSALEQLEPIATELGASRSISLAVAGAFHTPLMKPADERLSEVLGSADIQPPRIPVYSNVSATPHPDDPDQIRAALAGQVTQSVRWDDSMRRMLADGFDTFYEIGPGRVLTGLLKRIDRKVPCTSIPAR